MPKTHNVADARVRPIMASNKKSSPRSRSNREKDQDPLLKVLLVDDHPLVREGLKMLLEENPKCGELYEASTGAEAVDIFKKEDIDVVLLDLHLQDEFGLETLKKIKKINGEASVIVLSASEASHNVKEASNAGANGYLVKSASKKFLSNSLNLAIDGERFAFLSLNNVSKDDFEKSTLEKRSNEPDELCCRNAKLTNQERKVLKYVREGMSNKEIARALDIYEGTVKVHVRSIFKKLGVNNRTMAAMVASGVAQENNG